MKITLVFALCYQLIYPSMQNPPASPPTPSLQPMTIFYDAMDNNSQRFFNFTLVQQFPSVATSIDVTFIPCQLAKETNGDFTCPGTADPTCTLNKMHSCAISQIKDKTKLVPYLACTMSSIYKLPDFANCATKANIDGQKLQTCSTSDEGKNLMKSNIAKKPPENKKILPIIIFKRPDEIKSTDPFEYLDFYIDSVCNNDFQFAVCTKLKIPNPDVARSDCNKKLVMGIFYKTMDDKAQKWIQNFAKIYDKFASHLLVNFLPCMFAEMPDGRNLDCKDPGDPDCISAKTHACAVLLIQDPNQRFQFVKCATQDSTKIPDFQKCATDNKIDFGPIKECANNLEGKALCHELSKTRPKSDKIPSFVYGLTFDQKVSDDTAAATDLKPILCGQLKKNFIELPADCN